MSKIGRISYRYLENDEVVAIHQLTDDGSPNGDSVVLLEDVTEVCCDSQDEQAIKLLSEYQDK